jgi:hypothetical protein
VDKEQYPQHSDKAASLSGKAKMKADEVITDVPSDEDTNDKDVVSLGNYNATLEPDAQDSTDKEEEGNSEGQKIPLVGSWLDVVSVKEEEGEELARARGQASPGSYLTR